MNMMRSILAELGIGIPVGLEKALQMARQIVDGEAMPTEAANVVALLAGQLLQLDAQLRRLDLRLAALQRSNDTARRSATIPGNWPDRGDRARRIGDRPCAVPIGASVCGLAWPDPAAELEWRQGATGADHQDGR